MAPQIQPIYDTDKSYSVGFVVKNQSILSDHIVIERMW